MAVAVLFSLLALCKSPPLLLCPVLLQSKGLQSPEAHHHLHAARGVRLPPSARGMVRLLRLPSPRKAPCGLGAWPSHPLLPLPSFCPALNLGVFLYLFILCFSAPRLYTITDVPELGAWMSERLEVSPGGRAGWSCEQGTGNGCLCVWAAAAFWVLHEKTPLAIDSLGHPRGHSSATIVSAEPLC